MSSPEDSAEDLDDTAMWRAMRERSVEKRAENREQSARILERAGVRYIARNNGAHLTVTRGKHTVDFWPGTGKWMDRAGPKGRGVFKLLKHLGCRLANTSPLPDRTPEIDRMNAQVSSAAAAAPRFIKIGEDGALLSADAAEWVAVLDTKTNLMWAVEVLSRRPYKEALEAPKSLSTGGFKDWRLPTVEELFCLADRTRYEPAIDTDYFPETPSSWFWSSTVDASSPSVYAWGVSFSLGSSSWGSQDLGGFVRAVRPGQ